MVILKILLVEITLASIFLIALYYDQKNYINKTENRKPKKSREIKLRNENYPFQ